MRMKSTTPALLLAAACLLGRPAFAETGAETLRQLLAREHLDFQVTRGEDLDKPVSSGDTLDTAETRIIATYVPENGLLGDRVYVFRLAKRQGTWRAAEVRWPKSSDTLCQGGASGGRESRVFSPGAPRARGRRPEGRR